MLSLRVSVPPFTERLFGDKEEEVRVLRLRWGVKMERGLI